LTHAQDLDLLSTRAENPLSNVATLTFNHIFSAHVGRFRRPQNITNVQPNVPVSLSPDWNVVIRSNTPVTDQPVGRFDREFGIGDTTIQALFTRKNPGPLAWGIGPVVTMPTRTGDALGFGMPGAGVGIAVVKSEALAVRRQCEPCLVDRRGVADADRIQPDHYPAVCELCDR
jgi:hypothetical protein